MNGNFRSPKFIKRYEYSYFDLQTPLNANVGANNRQRKDNYLFVVGNSSQANPVDRCNAYLEVNFKLLATNQEQDGAGIGAGTGNANLFSTATNGPTFIREIQVECNGITVYNNTIANESSSILSLLKYTKEYANTVAKRQFLFIFIDMFAPKWARGPHNLARFPFWDPCSYPHRLVGTSVCLHTSTVGTFDILGTFLGSPQLNCLQTLRFVKKRLFQVKI